MGPIGQTETPSRDVLFSSRSAEGRRGVQQVGFAGSARAAAPAGSAQTPATWAQNAPPKPSTDCGVTAICPQPTQHVTHPAPLWAVELIMFGLLVVVLLLGYRLVLRRRNVEE